MARTITVYFKTLRSTASTDVYIARVLPQSMGPFPMGTSIVSGEGATPEVAEAALKAEVKKLLRGDRIKFEAL